MNPPKPRTGPARVAAVNARAALAEAEKEIRAEEVTHAMAQALVAQAVRVDDDRAWIYFLKDVAGAVLYVGVSLQVVRRSRGHRQVEKRLFDSVYMVPTPFPRAIALRLEAALIRTLDPPLNRTLTGRQRGTILAQLFPGPENATGPVAAEPAN